MANFKAWVEKSPRSKNFLIRYRDGRTKLSTGRYKVFTEMTIDKDQRIQIDGTWKTAKWIAEDLADKLRMRHINDLRGECDTSKLLAPLMEKYLTSCEDSGLVWMTTEHYEHVLNKIASEGDFKTLGDLTDDKVSAWRTSKIGELANSTVANQMVIFFVFCRWLLKNKFLKHWPFSTGLVPSVKRGTPKFYTLMEWEKLDAVLADLSPMARLACNLAYYAGLRKVELVGDGRDRLGVLWEDLTWLPDGEVELTVRGEVAKGGERTRIMLLDPNVVKLLGSRKSGPIVTITRREFDYLFAKARRLAGINPERTIHGQRHSFIKNYLRYGEMDLAAAQEAAGHSDIKTTQIYAAHEKSRLAEGIRRAHKNRQIATAIELSAGQLQGDSSQIIKLARTKTQ